MVIFVCQPNRLRLGKIELRKENIDLASAVNDAVEAATPACESYSLKLVVALPPKPIRLYADPAGLVQVVGNLSNNACKFSDRGGQVHLTVAQEGSRPSSKYGTTASAVPPASFPAHSTCSCRSIRRWNAP